MVMVCSSVDSNSATRRVCSRWRMTASKPSAKPRRLAWAALPGVAGSPPRTTASYTSRPNGSTPLAAMQPSITALTTVPASRVSCAMSSTWCAWLCWRTRDSSAASSWRPSPMGIFSAVVSVRDDEVMTRVCALDARPLPICRAVSSSSLETSRSSRPGSGFRPNTGRRPARSASGTGKNSR
jgi:hypothetical protein